MQSLIRHVATYVVLSLLALTPASATVIFQMTFDNHADVKDGTAPSDRVLSDTTATYNGTGIMTLRNGATYSTDVPLPGDNPQFDATRSDFGQSLYLPQAGSEQDFVAHVGKSDTGAGTAPDLLAGVSDLTQLTFEFWFKPLDDVNNQNTVLTLGRTSDLYPATRFKYIGPNNLGLQQANILVTTNISLSGTSAQKSGVSTGVWHHVAMTWDSSDTMQEIFWIDGVGVVTNTLGAGTTLVRGAGWATLSMILGGGQFGGGAATETFHGYLDEVRLSTGIITPFDRASGWFGAFNIPEPSSVMLLLVGAGLIRLRRRRPRR